VVVLFLLSLCGCQAPRSDSVILWTAFEGAELTKIKELAAKHAQASGQKIQVLKVPFAELQRKFLIAAPAGQGPDIILGPQDWLGVFATAKLLSPLPCPDSGDYAEVAVNGVTYQREIYARPLLLDCLFLLRNPKLAPKSPKNLDELKSYALEIQAGGKTRGFYFDTRDFYFSWPFFAGFGCTVLEGDTLNIGFGGPGGEKALEYLKGLRDSGLVQEGAQNDFAKTMYLDQTLAMTLNGPWFLGDVRARKTPYVIEPIPPGTHNSSSLVGVAGLMLNAQSTHPDAAKGLIDFLSSTDCQSQMALASGRSPARKTALEVASKDPSNGSDILAVGKVAQQGVPLPNHPAANAVWEPMKQSIELVSKGQTQPHEELQRAKQRIELKIKMMVE
jgi:maltose-binding protein MalE